MSKGVGINIAERMARLKFLEGRTPQSTPSETQGSFDTLADYRNGGVFLAAFEGRSEWERHPHGDEIVMVVEGSTDLILLVDGEEVRNTLGAGELLVVPQNVWHRFETPGVKLMTVTPQPTDHSSEWPV